MTKNLIPTLIVILLCTSCTQTMYFPQHVNITHFRSKGEAKLNVSIKHPSDDFEKVYVSPSVDAAYAITNHWAVTGAYHTVTRDITSDTTYDLTPGISEVGGIFLGHDFEVGGGYFTSLGRSSTFEVLGGVGRGIINRTSGDMSYAPWRFDF